MLWIHAALSASVLACTGEVAFPPTNSSCTSEPGWTVVPDHPTCAAAALAIGAKSFVLQQDNDLDPIGCYYIPSVGAFGYNEGGTNSPLCGASGADCIEVCQKICATATPPTPAPPTQAPETLAPPTAAPRVPAAPTTAPETEAPLLPIAVYPPLGGTDDRAAYFVEVGKGPHEADASPAAQQQPPEDADGTQADIGVLTALPSVIVATGALGVLVMNRRWRGQLQEVTD
ncbi:hypothetical protein DIPPA_24648 [Diplonema papillatum]|nr:hypothetical protein DIPPA_24648 [Diplonema papillatum]